MTQNDIVEQCETIEECYEFMLSYAAKGLPAEIESASGRTIRDCLHRVVSAIGELVESCSSFRHGPAPEPPAKYLAFLDVIDRDPRDSVAAVELVLAQPSISSQLVDNLNASIHLRALLTDLFLWTDVLRSQPAADSLRAG